ncbi:tRNA (N(6)-L-threonylcarbamoyladenosine(37)-C(2))-methylthiotransferase MtaB [Faecalibacterium gallinarum]|uniref:tRNA (N(6)-L-threonylcarbamoyladenosine(37)-C(2))-methylthiotransferase MtaB n=1 Tax=Faecalibacterium gallinarum TaxID=2903556 RepID=A0AA37MX31_9FIRM|nr:tRNA (N(6)-L-threonylcarbamoyladenosine(37)-C(2))-methylthiotransferase MtaB [Faecalibacterium gallinarum]GJN63542.1 tRNA (N(6)-L-threonylcarbamoyladenosine(37)-C(2))-methylthiotransferase MtaB [Faecalibacterium gallinarum]
MRVCFYTLGCKVNLNETEALEQLFRRNGFTIVPEGEAADVFIVNSCTVTNFGDQKSRKWLRRAKRENPGAVTVLTGCYPQAFPEEAGQFVEADLVCGNGDRKAILDNVRKLLDGHERIVAITPHTRGELFEELPVERFETHTRAFIKVEDGCNRQCAYCVIPRARGPVRSRSEASILAELNQLAGAGYREVVLSAISLPSYGLDTGTNLVELVEKCAQVEGIQRIRLGSLDPDMLSDEAIARLAAVDKLCPQFHLSLQSGCSATLRRMCRVYTAEQYAEVVAKLRAAYGGRPISFTTDCICGFPGESQADFEESCRFLEKIGFLKVHVFPYSRRSGTPAYDFPDQIHEREKQARSRTMNEVAERVRAQVLATLKGTEDEVLLETALSATLFTGYTRLYVPVVVSAPGHVSGEIVRVRLGKYDGERVQAALC